MHFPSSAAPALTVSSPTATTVSFTVSTRAPRTTFPAHILHAMALLLRLAVALSIFGLWWVKWTGFKPWPRQEMDSRDGQYSPVWTDWAMASVYDVVELCRWRWLASAGLVTLFIVVRRGYKGGFNSVIKHYRELRGGRITSIMRTSNIRYEGFGTAQLLTEWVEESLVVLRGLGIQTTSSSPTYLATSTTRFIPTTSIQDIFIHEAFRGFEVRFYLCVVVVGEEDSVVVFPVSGWCARVCYSRVANPVCGRICYPKGRFLRKYGEGRGSVCTSRAARRRA